MSTTYLKRLSLLAVFVSAASAAGPELAVEVLGATAGRADAPGNRARVEVRLRNVSKKIVTAWAYTVEGQYPDGSKRKTSLMSDNISALLVNALTATEKRAEALSALTAGQAAQFRSGTVRTLPSMLPLGDQGEVPISVVAKVEMVALDDGSALGDPATLRRLMAARRSMAAYMSTTLDEIQAARRAADPKGALKELIARRSQAGAGGHSGIMLLQLVPLFDQGPAVVDRAVAVYEAYRDLLVQHSTLRGEE